MADAQSITLFVLVLITAVSALTRVTSVPYPILLVVVGSAVGFAPGLPRVDLEPDLVLHVILPPLLFNAASSSSARDLRAAARVITLSAVGLVVATTALVAVAVHALVPDLPWAAAFALGAIVSPTDPLAATQVGRRLGLPRRLMTSIEGESLVNDGSALVLYQAAVAVAGAAAFDAWRTGGLFVVEVVGGAAIGLVVGLVTNRLLERTGGDGQLGLMFTLTVGYVAYVCADEVHVSGVLAVVACGVVVGRRGTSLVSSSARLTNIAFWEILVFLLNALLFASVGLQLPSVLASQDRSAGTLVALGAAVAATTILARIVWVHLVTYVIRAVDRRPSQRARRASWPVRVVSSWCGLRGAVSLAAALALPASFPERDLLVFLALCVIWATLVGQGLTLPWLIQRLGLEDDGEADAEELYARRSVTRAALDQVEELDGEAWARADVLDGVREHYVFQRRRLMQRAGDPEADLEIDLEVAPDEDAEARSRNHQRVIRAVIGAERAELIRLRDAGDIGDEVLRRVERDLDLEEERLET